MIARSVSAAWLICAFAAALLFLAPQGAATPFPRTVLGASLFRAAWAYRHDRPWLEDQLAFLARHHFDAIRALGVVGHPGEPGYWDGREIDWRWDDYDEVIAGLTDLAFDKHGIRVQWTIFADAQRNIPSEDDRARLVERFVAMARGREHKILAFEVANEYWQNGFEGADGLRQLRRFAARLRQTTDVPVAASAHRPELCPIYSGGAVDFATVHFDRSAPHSRWTPLLEPWRAARRKGRFASCELPEAASNNEPLGPGSSVASTPDASETIMSAVNTYVTGIPVYMLHTGPGVRDDPEHETGLRPAGLDQLPGAAELFGGLGAMRTYVPDDVFAWTPVTPGSGPFPFTLPGKTGLLLAARRGDRFIVTVSDVEGTLDLTARMPMKVRVIDPVSPAADAAERSLRNGERLEVNRRAAVIVGTMAGSPP